MSTRFKSSRDIIVRTKKFSEALNFYGTALGLQLTQQDKKIAGFETGSFCLYVEKGEDHGPVLEFLVPDIQSAKKKLVAAGCVVVEEDPSLPRCYIKDPYGLIFNIAKASPDK